MPFLYCIQPDGSALARTRLRREPLLVGRSESADLPLADDPFLSDEHFLVFAEADGVCIRDLRSKNGTWVNGRRVHEHKLLPHDRIRAGRSLFALEPGLVTMMAELTKTPC